ncbi:MAG: hypothetical protein PHU71_00610 [Candidatus Gracilibacteria bacterium]|nr:hypothetical protein [Candidatus Gracilibacteria bacterium]
MNFKFLILVFVLICFSGCSYFSDGTAKLIGFQSQNLAGTDLINSMFGTPLENHFGIQKHSSSIQTIQSEPDLIQSTNPSYVILTKFSCNDLGLNYAGVFKPGYFDNKLSYYLSYNNQFQAFSGNDSDGWMNLCVSSVSDAKLVKGTNCSGDMLFAGRWKINQFIGSGITGYVFNWQLDEWEFVNGGWVSLCVNNSVPASLMIASSEFRNYSSDLNQCPAGYFTSGSFPTHYGVGISSYMSVANGYLKFCSKIPNAPIDPWCGDNLLNGGETEIDCGGPCNYCGWGPSGGTSYTEDYSVWIGCMMGSIPYELCDNYFSDSGESWGDFLWDCGNGFCEPWLGEDSFNCEDCEEYCPAICDPMTEMCDGSGHYTNDGCICCDGFCEARDNCPQYCNPLTESCEGSGHNTWDGFICCYGFCEPNNEETGCCKKEISGQIECVDSTETLCNAIGGIWNSNPCGSDCGNGGCYNRNGVCETEQGETDENCPDDCCICGNDVCQSGYPCNEERIDIQSQYCAQDCGECNPAECNGYTCESGVIEEYGCVSNECVVIEQTVCEGEPELNGSGQCLDMSECRLLGGGSSAECGAYVDISVCDDSECPCDEEYYCKDNDNECHLECINEICIERCSHCDYGCDNISGRCQPNPAYDECFPGDECRNKCVGNKCVQQECTQFGDFFYCIKKPRMDMECGGFEFPDTYCVDSGSDCGCMSSDPR